MKKKTLQLLLDEGLRKQYKGLVAMEGTTASEDCSRFIDWRINGKGKTFEEYMEGKEHE